jgi:DNA-binding CsgD family transcriptional regulator
MAARGRYLQRPPPCDRLELEAPVRSSELSEALMACDFAVLVWELPQGVVRIANEPAARLSGRTVYDLIGLQVVDLLDPRDAVEQVVAGLGSRAIDGVQAHRRIHWVDGKTVPVVVWSRALDLDERRAVVSLVVPINEVGRLGRDPSAPWRDLSPVAVGTADREWRVKRVSADLRDIVKQDPGIWVGSSILDMVHPDDVAALVDPERAELEGTAPRCRIRFPKGGGGWVEVCFLFAAIRADSSEIAFAVVGTPETSRPPSNRVAELELRLRHIGAEVRASGVLNDFESVPAPSDHPQLGELTSRQWEILNLILRGERASAIAKALYLSPSTVRNHLTVIFRKFGVHSQLELVQKLRPLSEPYQRPA